MSVAESPSSFEMSDYLGVLRRRWWIILIFVIIGAAAGGAYMKVTPKSYSSTVSIYVTATAATANQVSGGRTNGAVNMDSEAQVAQSLSVQRIAESLLHTTTPGSISTAVPPNSEVLQITCSASSGAAAAGCANAYGQAYLQVRNATAKSTIRTQLNTLQHEATTLQASSDRLTRQLAGLPHTNANSSKRSTLSAQLKAQHSQLTSLNKKIANLNLQDASTSVGYVISKAEAPSSPSSPKLTLIVPSGLMAGLLLGVVAALLADRPGRRFYTVRDVERQLQLPALLSLPRKNPGWQGSLVSPRSRSGQAFTDLAHVTASTLGEGSHVIFVASDGEGYASSKVAVNLAAALARTRADVVLASASPRSASVAQLPGQGAARGLLELLAGTAQITDVALKPVEAPGLRIIPRGQDSLLSFDQFQHRSLERLISELRGEGRYVVVDAPAAGDGSDGFVLAEFADAAIVVIELTATRKADMVECVSRLDRWRSTILGAAVVPPARKPAARKPAAGRPVPAQPSPARPPKRRGKNAEDEAPPARLDQTLPLPQMSPDSNLLDRYSVDRYSVSHDSVNHDGADHDGADYDGADHDGAERDRHPDTIRGN